jgi:hypothetical protein
MKGVAWGLAFASAAAALGCVDAGSEADTVAPRLLAVEPPNGSREVSPFATFWLRFSEPLAREAALSSHGAVLVEGVPTSAVLGDLQQPPISHPSVVECERMLPQPNTLALRPRWSLKARAVYSLVATRNLRDPAGNRLVDTPAVSSFATGLGTVRLVVPDGPAPPNLAEVVLSYDLPPPEPLHPGDLRVEDDAGRPVAVLPSERLSEPGLRGLRLLEPLKMAASYRVVARVEEGEAAFAFTTTERPDEQPPRVLHWEVSPFEGEMEVEASLDEPAWVQVLVGDSPEILAPVAWSRFAREHRIGVSGSNRSGEIFLRIEVRDSAGLSTLQPTAEEAPRRLLVHPRIRVELSEVVTSARRDWGDRRCQCTPPVDCGAPFDENPGCETRLGSGDEWVELMNRSGQVLDLTAGPAPWRVRVVDTTPEETSVGVRQDGLYLPPGSTLAAWQPGAFLVLRTKGNSNNDARIELVDPWGSVTDALALGQGGAPSGKSTGPEDEAVARMADGRWCRTRATPGGPNRHACASP